MLSCFFSDWLLLPVLVPVPYGPRTGTAMLENQLQPSAELATRTVRQTVEVLAQRFLSRVWELCGDASGYNPHGCEDAC